MKYLLTISICLLLFSKLSAQNNNDTEKGLPIPTYTLVAERLNVDFEIKGNPQVDRTTLERINLYAINEQRQPNIRVEIIDQLTGLTIIIYSATEATNKKTIRYVGSEE